MIFGSSARRRCLHVSGRFRRQTGSDQNQPAHACPTIRPTCRAQTGSSETAACTPSLRTSTSERDQSQSASNAPNKPEVLTATLTATAPSCRRPTTNGLARVTEGADVQGHIRMDLPTFTEQRLGVQIPPGAPVSTLVREASSTVSRRLHRSLRPDWQQRPFRRTIPLPARSVKEANASAACRMGTEQGHN